MFNADEDWTIYLGKEGTVDIIKGKSMLVLMLSGLHN